MKCIAAATIEAKDSSLPSGTDASKTKEDYVSVRRAAKWGQKHGVFLHGNAFHYKVVSTYDVKTQQVTLTEHAMYVYPSRRTSRLQALQEFYTARWRNSSILVRARGLRRPRQRRRDEPGRQKHTREPELPLPPRGLATQCSFFERNIACKLDSIKEYPLGPIALAERNIKVCNVPDYGTAEVADHAIALALCMRRGLLQMHDESRKCPCFA